MDGEDDTPEKSELISRAPTQEDLVSLARALNAEGALYLVVGGFAIISAGYPRSTGDLDLLIDTDLANEAKVFRALEILPDKAVRMPISPALPRILSRTDFTNGRDDRRREAGSTRQDAIQDGHAEGHPNDFVSIQ